MRILSRPTLAEFYDQRAYADSKQPLLSWYQHVSKDAWKEPANVKDDFGSASILKDGRVVFNVGGNKYRLIVSINYPTSVVYIKFIGTHKQYDAIDAQTVEVKHGN